MNVIQANKYVNTNAISLKLRCCPVSFKEKDTHERWFTYPDYTVRTANL